MRNNEEILKLLIEDWETYYSKQISFDESNHGDSFVKGARDYIIGLLGVHHCEVCGAWFDTFRELYEHVKEKHPRYIFTEREEEYCWGFDDWYNVFFIPPNYNNLNGSVKIE